MYGYISLSGTLSISQPARRFPLEETNSVHDQDVYLGEVTTCQWLLRPQSLQLKAHENSWCRGQVLGKVAPGVLYEYSSAETPVGERNETQSSGQQEEPWRAHKTLEAYGFREQFITQKTRKCCVSVLLLLEVTNSAHSPPQIETRESGRNGWGEIPQAVDILAGNFKS